MVDGFLVEVHFTSQLVLDFIFGACCSFALVCVLPLGNMQVKHA